MHEDKLCMKVMVWLDFVFFHSRGGYIPTGTSQSLSGALNRQNQMMQGSGIQGAAFGRRYWCHSCLKMPTCSLTRLSVLKWSCLLPVYCFVLTVTFIDLFDFSSPPPIKGKKRAMKRCCTSRFKFNTDQNLIIQWFSFSECPLCFQSLMIF